MKEKNKHGKNKYKHGLVGTDKFWKALHRHYDEVGWKPMYFMILDFQDNVVKETGYVLKKTV